MSKERNSKEKTTLPFKENTKTQRSTIITRYATKQANNQQQEKTTQTTQEQTPRAAPETQTPKMNQNQIQQNIANFVPEFSGEQTHNRTHELMRFIDTATSIHETLTTEEERKIFNRLIKLKLTGDAYMRLSYIQVANFKELCDILNSMYIETYSLNELERRLTTTTQTYGESIRNYGYRLLETLERYKTAYKIKYGLEVIDEAYTNHLNSVMVQAFKRGLSNNILKEKIATTKAKDISEIIRETEIIDKMLTDSTSTPASTITPPTQPQRSQIKQTVICNYCQRPNHTWDICRTRLNHEQPRKTFQFQQYNNPPPKNEYRSRQPYNPTHRQGANYQANTQSQPYYNQQRNQPFNRNPHGQINFEPVRQQPPYPQHQTRNNFTPKYCSHCKTTRGHTFEECRSKFLNLPNHQLRQNNTQTLPDANALTDNFNKMRINTIAPPQQDTHHQPPTNPGNGQGSNQQ